MKTALFIHDPSQAAFLSHGAASLGSYEVIAVGADIEFVLEARGVKFRSARAMRATSTSERLVRAREIGESVLSDPSLAFLSYRGIHIGDLFTHAFQDYLARFLYYFDIVVSVCEESGYDRFAFFSPNFKTLPMDPVLSQYQRRIFLDAIHIACSHRNIKLVALDVPATSGTLKLHAGYGFSVLARPMFGFVIRVLNHLVRIVVRQRKIRILATEYWGHISDTMKNLPEAEIILIDREQSRNAGIRAIFQHRMQFMHPENFLNSLRQRVIGEKVKELMHEWNLVCKAPTEFSHHTFRGYLLGPHLDQILDHIVRFGTPEALRRIEGSFAMFEELKPDVLLVRASTSAQIHFAVLCHVARACGIPALENQHGLFSFARETFATNHAAEYIAEYGPLVREELKSNGYTDDKLFDVGSPRFDAHALQIPRSGSSDFQVTLIAPDAVPGFYTDPYDVEDYFSGVAKAVAKISNCRVTIKLRPLTTRRTFFHEAIRRAFGDHSHIIMENEALARILGNTDVVVTCFSAALLESLLSNRPTIYYAPFPIYQAFRRTDLAPHERDGALTVADTSEDLGRMLERFARDSHARQVQSQHALEFMRTNYSFDGGDAERLANTIRNLADV